MYIHIPGMERNVDQTDPEEVPEEEEQGGAERSEIKEDEEEAEMKVVSEKLDSLIIIISMSFSCLKMWNWNQILFKPPLI